MEPTEAATPLTLVVDDETAIREAVRDILELADIPSILAANGQEAIELYRQYGERIRLIILDLRMPVMSGAETYRALRESGAAMPIILSSGYDDKISDLDFDSDPKLSLLRKPYALDVLLDAVRTSLATR